MPDRIDFWGIPDTWGPPELWVYGLMGISIVVLLVRFYMEAAAWWQVGRREDRWNRIHLRLWRLVKYGIFQTRVLGQQYPGVMHVAIAWSFFVFFLGTALATIDSHIVEFLVGRTYLAYKLVLDLFAVVFVVGAVMAAYRRFVLRPSRLTLAPAFAWSIVALCLVVVGGLLTESLRLAVERPEWAWWSPAGWVLARVWINAGASDATLKAWHIGVWAFHLLAVALTIMTLPVGSLLHLLTGPLSVLFAKTDAPMGRLAPIPAAAGGASVYAGTLRGLTWKQLLDGSACAECGRCQDACPAFAAGMPLSPKKVILGIRDALRQQRRRAFSRHAAPLPLVGGTISDDVLWSCTTCAACVRECPVLIEHVDTIVDMRRYLVVEGRVDAELQDALANLGRYGNSFGQSERLRARWTQALDPKIKDARREPVEYLWFVGDYASYSPVSTDATVKTAQLFQKADVNFGILYDGERNAGNDARRAGEEGLFEMLAEKNVGVLSKCSFEKIITTDPHSYNTLKNEYDFNGSSRHPVLHVVELLDQLIASGALNLRHDLGSKVTYHDPCYLGRYNGIYDAPRRVIRATGCDLIEMPRHGDRAACCGAGGGRIWMKEGEMLERPSEARVREAVAVDGVGTLVTTCPKDVSMFRDAVKTTGNEDRLVVKDLVELVHAAL
ncbi:MAG: (Fe-S)-binding protein [Chloroflexota bacterium]